MNGYNTRFDPPAPLMEITVANPTARRRRRVVSALLDTGLDITAIPSSLIESLQLYPIGQVRLETVEGTTTKVLTYAIQLVIAGLSIPHHEVIPTGLDFVVVGRDVLNRMYLLLNGPEGTFDLRVAPFLDDPTIESSD